MVLLGSWAVLMPQKLWERQTVSWPVQRLMMLLVGLGLGAGSVALATWSRLTPAPVWQAQGLNPALVSWTETIGGSPMLGGLGYASYVAILFAILPWRSMTSRDRWSRFRFVPVIKTGLLAALLGTFWPSPQPWGLMLFVLIAVLVQVVSPWQPRGGGTCLRQPSCGRRGRRTKAA